MTALLPALLCGGGMVLCFVMMNRMHGKDDGQMSSSDGASSEEVAALREELTRLRSEVRDNATQPGDQADRSLN